jgi:hypothetical protein
VANGGQEHLCPTHWRQFAAAEARQQQRARFFSLFTLRPGVERLRGVVAAFATMPAWIGVGERRAAA